MCALCQRLAGKLPRGAELSQVLQQVGDLVAEGADPQHFETLLDRLTGQRPPTERDLDLEEAWERSHRPS